MLKTRNHNIPVTEGIGFPIPQTSYTKPFKFMVKYLCAPVVLIFGFTVCCAQLPDSFPFIDKTDLPGSEFLSTRVFNRTALYGYIDGGAELYLEYGFSVVSVSEIEYLGGKYKTEIYKMSGPEEAFGIFSVMRYNCVGMPDITEFTCQTRYQLQICSGSFYISIINRSGSGSDTIASIAIGRAITGKIRERNADLSSYLPGISSGNIKRNCFLVKGRLGIVNGSPDLEDFFKEMNDYSAVILKSEDRTIVSVKFRNKESYAKFIVSHNWNDKSIENGGIRLPEESVKKIAENHLQIELSNH